MLVNTPTHMDNRLKIVYNRPNNIKISEQDKSLLKESVRRIINDEENSEFYPNLYNLIYFVSNNTSVSEFTQIFDQIVEMIKNRIKDLFKTTSHSSCQNINISEHLNSNPKLLEVKHFIQVYKKSESMVEKVKILFTNNKLRFNNDISIVTKINSLNHKFLMKDYINTPEGGYHLNLLKIYIIQHTGDADLKLNKDFLLQTINFIKTVGAWSVLNEIIEAKIDSIMTAFKIDSENEMNNITEDNLASYIIKYDDKIQSTCFNFKILFGEIKATILMNKLIEISLTSRLLLLISNDKIVNSLITSNNYYSLNLIYKLMMGKNETSVLFQEKFFAFYVERFYRIMKVPSNIREGLKYIDFLLEQIKMLNDIFVNCFGKDRRVILRYKEALSRVINNKNIKNMYILCGVYINEIMSRSVGNPLILKELLNSFSEVLGSMESTENFFSTVQKLLIRRVSNFNFNEANEIFLVSFLRKVFGARHCFGLFRLMNDIKQSQDILKKTSKGDLSSFFDKGALYLFSFNVINKNDMTPVVNCLNSPFKDICNQISTSYTEIHPHRVVRFSLNLSTAIITPLFNKKIDLLVNLVQLNIIQLINSRNKSVKLEDLVKVLDVKNIPLLRTNIISLVNSNIILVNNNSVPSDTHELLNQDEFTVNLNFTSDKNFLNLTELSLQKNASVKIKDDLNRDHTSQSDIQALENSMESQTVVFNANKVYITDSKLMKIIKMFSQEGVEHNTLVKLFLQEMKKYFSEQHCPDIGLIKKRIDAIIERNLIKRRIDDKKIVYEFL